MIVSVHHKNFFILMDICDNTVALQCYSYYVLIAEIGFTALSVFKVVEISYCSFS